MSLSNDLVKAGTAVISDVLDDLGHRPAVLSLDLAPLRPGIAFAGPAYTIAGQSSAPQGGDRLKMKAIDEMPAGCVPVWAGNDIRGVCCFGDLLASAMQARGVVGVVVDGGIRDSAFLASLEIGFLARYRSPAQAIGRWHATAFEEPVQVPGAIDDLITVVPGDMIVVDDDGGIVIPAGLVVEVTQRATARAEGEASARDEIAEGLPLLSALEKFGHL